MNVQLIKQNALAYYLAAEVEAIHKKNGSATPAEKKRLLAIADKMKELREEPRSEKKGEAI